MFNLLNLSMKSLQIFLLCAQGCYLYLQQLLFSSPPFVGLMIMFGFWCTGVVGIVCGFAIYYVFQREVFAAVAKEDIKLFHKGIRLATKIQDSKALYVVVEGGEDRDD